MATSVNDDENIASMQEANSGEPEEGKILQTVEKTFDANQVFESRQYKFAMSMLEDPKLKGN